MAKTVFKLSKLNIVYSFLLQSGPQNTPSILGPLPIYHPADHDVRYQSAVWKCNVYFDIQATHNTKQVFLRIHLFSLREWCTWKILRPKNWKNTKKSVMNMFLKNIMHIACSSCIGGIHFFTLPVCKIWAYMVRYYGSNSDLIGANLFVKAQTIPQNAKCVGFFFSFQKVAFLKIFVFWIWLRFFRNGFLQYWNM